ncbi:hypothetical protein AJ80_07793 [Polytolypa hystricis UAMH7299]|uniref:Cyanovirin-N domain-containing protein n=1 Tax=Polytolypa hystricis (strain UAMH7299) TaxID=1447883 RepID=A0A2B7XIJ8_POLH7|nr:hypothetical protein AJ80_07793 [Polytolypa hystricis UAMH7299]
MKPAIFTTIIAIASSAVVSVSASYANSCQNCRLEKRSAPWLSGDDHAPILICECGDGKGGKPTTKLDLNQCLMNKNGFMLPQKNGNFGLSCNMFGLIDTKITAMCKY